MDPVSILACDAAAMETRLDALAALLCDAVAHGASVNFLAGLQAPRARQFWEGQIAGLAAGTTHLLLAERDGVVCGTVLLFLAQQPNAPHRAEIGKMLVHSGQRRQGLGRRLLAAAETAARQAGRSLLLLDTEAGSAGDKLYRACGWTEFGRVPDHAFRPHGVLGETVYFYKQIGPHPHLAGR